MRRTMCRGHPRPGAGRWLATVHYPMLGGPVRGLCPHSLPQQSDLPRHSNRPGCGVPTTIGVRCTSLGYSLTSFYKCSCISKDRTASRRSLQEEVRCRQNAAYAGTIAVTDVARWRYRDCARSNPPCWYSPLCAPSGHPRSSL